MQDTKLVLDNNSICVQCIFADTSPADGCHIEVTHRGTTIKTIDIIRQDNSNSVEDCISDISSGIYNISIYYNNDSGTIPVALYQDIVFIHQWSSMMLTSSYIPVPAPVTSASIQANITTTTTSLIRTTGINTTIYYLHF